MENTLQFVIQINALVCSKKIIYMEIHKNQLSGNSMEKSCLTKMMLAVLPLDMG